MTTAEVRALRDPLALRRILAHAKLDEWQMRKLYPSKHQRIRCKQLIRTARKIEQYKLHEYCVGMGERNICNAVCGTDDPDAMKRSLVVLGERATEAWAKHIEKQSRMEFERELIVRARQEEAIKAALREGDGDDDSETGPTD